MEKTSDYLTIRLKGLSKVEDQSPQSRLAALIFQDHLRRKRASRPLTGPYYWVPYPVKGQKKYGWKLIAFFDNDGYDNFLMHDGTAWSKVRNLLRDWWSLGGFQVKALESIYTGLPRGRVTESPNPRGGKAWLIRHGNNSPVPNFEQIVMGAYSLPAGRVQALFDSHEQAFLEEVKTVQQTLGLSWKAKELEGLE